MNPVTNSNRLFILGAGFSKPAGIPDARELTDAILSEEFRLGNDDFKAWIKDIRARIAHLEGVRRGEPYTALNIEQLFEYAPFDRELWMMKQQTLPVDRNAGATFHERAEAISSWLSSMEEALVDVLITKQLAANPSILTAFVEQLRRGDSVLTFNYDTLLEERITESGKTWAHGFSNETPADVAVLKLHGSLDWWMSHRERPIPGATLLFQKEDLNFDWATASEDEKEACAWEDRHVLFRVDSLQKALELNAAFTGLDRGHPRFPGLGGLGAYKPLHRLVGSGVVWQKAFAALKQADEVFVVGWSCSPYDLMARFHFSSVMRSRERQPSRTVVIDPNATRLETRLKAVFGELQIINKCSQKVNWALLLGEQLRAG